MSAGRDARGTGAVDEDRLPRSIGGLFAFAFSSYIERAPLFLLLAFAAFAASAIVEAALPATAPKTQEGQFKLFVLLFTSVFADAFAVAAVALGIGTRVGGSTAPARTLTGAAVERWLRVIAVTLLSQMFILSTSAYSGLEPLPDPRAFALLAVPFTWLMWTMLGLTGPIAALSVERSGLAVIMGFGRAFTLSLKRANIARLCLLAVVTMIPFFLQAIVFEQLVQHHVARAIFWANVPIDALTIGPLAALQTVFALDFARRAGVLEPPKL